MPLTDTKGATWAHENTIKAGDWIKPDGGFDCLREGAVCQVHQDSRREGISGLYVKCDDGRHYLDGQFGDNGELIGIYPASAEEVALAEANAKSAA